jgi:DNA-binding IclR family transcriptional regulator
MARPRKTQGERGNSVQAVVRALALLDALADAPSDLGIAELSRRVGLHASTTHRLLSTLLSLGYVRQDGETNRYALGAKAFHLAESYLAQMDLRRIARPGLERLCQETGETANLVILDGREALYLDKAESPQTLRIFSRIGRRAPLYCTAVGKVLLADRPKAEADALVGRGPFEALTAHTITSAAQLRRELQKTREQGFALDREECEEGGYCIAAPLRNARGRVEAALSVSGPTLRLTAARVEEIVPIVCRIAQEISLQLGAAVAVR